MASFANCISEEIMAQKGNKANKADKGLKEIFGGGSANARDQGLRKNNMEKLSAQKLPPGAFPLEQSGTKLPAFLVPSIQLFSTNNFRICSRIILFFMFLFLLVNPSFSELVEDSKTFENNHTVALGPIQFSSLGDLFYNGTSTKEGYHYHSNTSGMCLKEHRIKERDLWEEENHRPRKRKERNHENNRKSGSARDEEVEDFGVRATREASEGMSTCSSCAREEIRKRSLETIKDSILSKLGMSQPPNITGKLKPEVAEQLLEMMSKRRHMQHSSNGLYWVVQDEEINGDLDGMQGDEPYRTSEKVNGRNSDHSTKSSHLRSHDNASDKYGDSVEAHEGEVFMEEEDDYHVRTERIVAFSQPHPRLRHLPHLQYFEFSERVRMSKVKRALLWIYIKGRESTSVVGNKITISIYKILDTGRSGTNGSRESPVITAVKTNSTRSIPKGSGAWITMDYIQIKNLVAEWFRYPQQNLGIVISAEDANRTNLAVTSHEGGDMANVPFLEVYVADHRKHRAKRMVGLDCKNSSQETRCCRYPLTVDFAEFGWDWVIAPKKYDAFYCAGECPMVFMPFNVHTHIFMLSDAPRSGACCAPRKLSEIEMLYFDENFNIILGKIPAMKVDRCGCT